MCGPPRGGVPARGGVFVKMQITGCTWDSQISDFDRWSQVSGLLAILPGDVYVHVSLMISCLNPLQTLLLTW